MKGSKLAVGFVGLDDRGAAIARRIARAGFQLIACDTNEHTLAAFAEPGVTLERDPLEVADRVDVLCACVRSDRELLALVANGALFRELDAEGVFIVQGTVTAALCRELADLAKNYDVDLLDVAFSGDSAATLFVGGEQAAFERVRPLLASYSESVALVGGVGRGIDTLR